MTKKSTSADLLAQLGKTMKIEERKAVSAPPREEASEARKTTPQKKTAAPPKKSKSAQRVANQNISLYPENRDMIFEIQTLIRKHTGKKCSDSRAVQLALKICPLKDSGKILAAFSEVSSLDGRSSQK